MSAETTLPGETYGLLTAIEKAGRNKHGQFFWRYACACGHEVTLNCMSVKRGTPDSCGCRYGKPGTNGRRRAEPLAPPDYKSWKVINRSVKHRRPHNIVWAGMRGRCLDPSHKAYPRYGGRGITICDRWLSGEGDLTGFDCFCLDMGPRPPRTQIERIDNAGNYHPENCRWATRSEQARNTRTNRMVMYRGQIRTLAEACEMSGVTRHQFRKRFLNGWTEERALDPTGETIHA